MSNKKFEEIIENAWLIRDTINVNTTGEIRDTITSTLEDLDCGKLRVAEKDKIKNILHLFALECFDFQINYLLNYLSTHLQKH